ncbi:MAG: enoyl-CoA hydratase/isomerase family protein [Acidisphaera sp.]|nr:enoyl-CoA hydratase/isomerase family protein [Acidisphaera sp.]
MTRSYETLQLEESGDHILTVRLNRPQVANALNTQMGRDLLDVFSSLAVDPEGVRCVILTGSGEKVFCAGADLKERNGITDEQWLAQHALFERTFRSILDCPLPVIAAINGAAFAGGLEMTMCCDFSYAVRTARFALTEVTLGIMPGGCGTQTLPRTVGERRAKEIILTGTPFSAEQAHAWGVVNRLCEPGEVYAETLAVARRIAGNAPLSVRQAKLSIHHGLQMDLRTGTYFEVEAYNRLVLTQDRQEGIRAFNEKRRPEFKGR